MAETVSPRMLDLLEIATYVFAADQYISREGAKMRAMGRDWRRPLAFKIPVRDPSFWNGPVRDKLAATLSFLSDDDFSFCFTEMTARRTEEPYLDLDSDGAKAGFQPDDVMLFSGGLDSLAGAVDLLEQGRDIALVSHRSSTFVRSRQSELVDQLRQRFAGNRMFHVGVSVGKQSAGTRDYLQRTRSFLFASLAAVVAALFKRTTVTFCENGVTSINLPLATHVLGARATRTTHPYVLAGYSDLFTMVAEQPIAVENRFFWKTKGEILRNLAASSHADLAIRSVSCTRTMAMTVAKGVHCGACSQCLDRYFTMKAAGLDGVDADYKFDVVSAPRVPGDDLVLAESYILSAMRWADMPLRDFGHFHGELFRLLPYLPAEGGIAKVADLLQRHGRDVRAVLNQALAEAGAADAVFGNSTSLLALLRNHSDPLAMARVAAIPAPAPTLPNPLVFAFDADGRFHMKDGFRLNGSNAQLLRELYASWLAGRATPGAAGAGFVASIELARKLNIDDPLLRRRITDLRARFHAHCVATYGVNPPPNALIETKKWKGYRLNPDLAEARLDSVLSRRSSC
jgi:7-cyano-7-deazaguanine synthase in queuosine biosynthesis